jgi:predicted small secreted protein
MKTKRLVAGVLLTVTATAILIYLLKQMKVKKTQEKEVVANAGYELAYDIHFPLKHNRQRNSRN